MGASISLTAEEADGAGEEAAAAGSDGPVDSGNPGGAASSLLEQEEEEEEERQEELALAESEGGDVVCELPKLDIPSQFRDRKRRFSVSAEVDRDPTAARREHRVVPKSAEALDRIKRAVSKSILFEGIEDDSARQIIFDAMEERQVANGDVVIKQGDPGDFFYVIDHGNFEVFDESDGASKKIWTYDGEGSFGELALMYNAPRSATVIATSAGALWAVDRETFRDAIVTFNKSQKSKHESFLEKTPLFANLKPQDRAAFADILIPTFMEDGRVVVRQGDPGDVFYLVERGEARVTVSEVNEATGESEEREVDRLTEGRYFGEAALITDEPRNATVTALGDLKLLAMGRAAYKQLIDRVYVN